MGKLVYGVGINDADYAVQPKINDKQVHCPYYQRWKNMLNRCYSKKQYQTYAGCEVAEEWKRFSNFKAWMIEQDWVGKEIDKDVLFPNNKLYSRDTCAFVSHNVNMFLTNNKATRGKYMIGVYWNKQHKKFQATCTDGEGKNIHLGLFDTEIEAHLAWKAYKHKLAHKLADEQYDLRIAEALRNRFV
jgi:hypothetical protein